MFTAVTLVRSSLLLLWLLSPPVLTISALRDWRRERDGTALRTLPLAHFCLFGTSNGQRI